MTKPDKTASQLQAELRSLRDQVSKLKSIEYEYKVLKKELQKRDKRFKAITENLNVGLYRNTIGTKGKFIEANPAVVKMFGFKSREGFLETDVVNLYVNPEERKIVSAKLEKNGFIRDEKLQLRKKDGTPFYSSVSAVAVKDESGKTKYFDGIIEDITDRVNAEKALRHSEKKFRNIVESSPMGMHLYELHEDGRLVFIGANPAADKILGVSNAQFVGKTIEEAFPPLAATEIPMRYRMAAAKGEFWKTDQISYEDDKISGAYEVYAFQTSPGKMAAMFLDITERMKTEEALRESEDKYRAIFESFYDVYYRTDRNGLVTIISPSVKAQAGYDPEDVIGHPVTDFYVDPSEREEFETSLKETGIVNDYELQLLAKDGRVIEVSASSRLVFNKEGKPIGVEGLLRDITERKRAEEQIKDSLKEKEVLLQEIHHRVKNNMQIISSLLNLQSSRLQDEKVINMFRESRDRIRAMALIHEKLYQSKDLARINFARYIESLALHLYHIYQVDSQKVILKKNMQDVFLDINSAIPCGLIINELLSNALKHAFPNGKDGEISLDFFRDGNGKYLLMVKDNGVGFPEGFDYQFPDSLGMQLVNDLVKQIGGDIELDSNGGTAFTITF